ncbi:MAG: bifunctional riboflavin kinase/FAD synthetase [Armatimonadota bacterium]
METVRSLEDLNYDTPSIVTIGVFDGVHIGHQLIMKIVRDSARDLHARSIAVTFDRNPEELVLKSGSPPYISTLDQKLRLIEEQGIDLAVVLPLRADILALTPEQFITDIICDKLNAVKVVVGTNFFFGKGRSGNVNLMQEMGAKLGFEVTSVQPVMIDNQTVSSTLIRSLISEGNVERAKTLLDHPFSLAGTVVEGQQIGRTLGYPTANIKPVEKQVIPGNGIYTVSTIIDDKRWPGVCSIGTRPTVGGVSATIEVYIIGFSGNIYGQKLEIEFHHRLRDEIRFEHLKDLIQQIGRDVERAMELMK